MVWLYILIFIISCLVLIRSGVWVVKSLTKIAQFLKWKEFIVASVLIAFSTSFPEIFIGITSALHQKPELSFGNIIGSNIIVLTLVITIGVILAGGLKFKGKILQKSSVYAGIYGLFPLLLMLDGRVSRVDGIVLLLALSFYFDQLLSEEERFTKIFSNHFKEDWPYFKLFLKNLAMFWIGSGLLLISAEGVVFSAMKLAASLNLPLVIIGTIFVALGTSLPEIAFGIRSITMGHKEMILGNVMGSVIINSTLVLGLTALISPFDVSDFSPYLRGIIFTVATCLFFVIFARTDRRITKREAIFLLGIYIFFVATEIFLK
ncbi:MAG: sodium:calcium antiporter [Candidatus Nealsonbacteria bacterium]|nr:MAG: sodium:calcium antiporter [Candidatus Nealsonbacteria bacterium]